MVGCASTIANTSQNGSYATVETVPSVINLPIQNDKKKDKSKDIPFFKQYDSASEPCYYWIPKGELETVKKDNSDDNSSKNK